MSKALYMCSFYFSRPSCKIIVFTVYVKKLRLRDVESIVQGPGTAKGQS